MDGGGAGCHGGGCCVCGIGHDLDVLLLHMNGSRKLWDLAVLLHPSLVGLGISYPLAAEM